MQWNRRKALAIAIVWGLFVSFLQTRTIFFLPTGTCARTHEAIAYPLRLLEFRDCLKEGHVFPQWCTNYRQGFGSPDFGYYQPGFFYAASVLPESLRLVDRLAITALAFTMFGYWFAFLITSRQFGPLAGLLAGTTLALSEYGLTNLCIRGDMSEYAAMNTIPAVLYFLGEWLGARGLGKLSGLAASFGLLIILHPCIALPSGIFISMILTGCLLLPRLRYNALTGFAGLLLGAGLAAFYCFPVFFEWDLISVNSAFEGHYHFAKSFIEPIALFVAGDTLVPTPLGLATFGLLSVSLVSVVLNWKNLSAPQRGILGLAASLAVFSIFLMSSVSRPVWDHMPLLYRLQFPFRLLAPLSVGAAILVGCLPRWKSSMPGHALSVWLLLNLCFLSASSPKRIMGSMPFVEPASAAALENVHFAPDNMDEWLPRGSTINRGLIYDRTVYVEPGTGTIVENYNQNQGMLHCHVITVQEGYIDLPHHYFPGWTATIDGVSVPIHPNSEGRIRVVLAAHLNGNLDVCFSMTPARRLGILVSANSLLLVLGMAWGGWLKSELD